MLILNLSIPTSGLLRRRIEPVLYYFVTCGRRIAELTNTFFRCGLYVAAGLSVRGVESDKQVLLSRCILS
ncbi:hypothetical protein CKO_03296 [Citrobacter koseri ATCC BAA-895]|uniref:Uncharacterized protein n=1 Tax=Citrobacter koseri (strain ATCC BAA-895 / CDC 4225-83 / SGSC4696) TaxID=290338 RepID=A8ALL7_CITK8|nr:hypothetical protein CKO_03296 [Citrobacter koseri ATCC BAA-895]